ncbi:MAG: cupin domain-containing protein [Devosia sp.]
MPKTSFFVAGDRAALVANDTADLKYRAAVHYVPPGAQVPIRTNESNDTICFVEVGTLEFMIGGPAGFVGAGGFIRVPRGVPFAYRNAGRDTARLLVRAELPASTRKSVRVVIEIAA